MLNNLYLILLMERYRPHVITKSGKLLLLGHVIWNIAEGRSNERPSDIGNPHFLQNENKNNTPLQTSTPFINKQKPFQKRILIIDDDPDITLTFKAGLEDNSKEFQVYTYNDPMSLLGEFKPNFYDLILIDINLPYLNGFELCQRILEVDLNVKVCFVTAGEINEQALRELYPNIGMGCFIQKPVTMDYLSKRLLAELD
jgi:CheY-like chemotaxis protein